MVQLAHRKLAELRRQCPWARRGDPEWEVCGLLRRNAEDVTGEQRDKLISTLHDVGTYGRWILAREESCVPRCD